MLSVWVPQGRTVLPTSYCILPITYILLLTTYCPLFAAVCLFGTCPTALELEPKPLPRSCVAECRPSRKIQKRVHRIATVIVMLLVVIIVIFIVHTIVITMSSIFVIMVVIDGVSKGCVCKSKK